MNRIFKGTEMFYRKILRIAWMKHTTNEGNVSKIETIDKRMTKDS